MGVHVGASDTDGGSDARIEGLVDGDGVGAGDSEGDVDGAGETVGAGEAVGVPRVGRGVVGAGIGLVVGENEVVGTLEGETEGAFVGGRVATQLSIPSCSRSNPSRQRQTYSAMLDSRGTRSMHFVLLPQLLLFLLLSHSFRFWHAVPCTTCWFPSPRSTKVGPFVRK